MRRGVLRALGAYGVLIWLLAQGLVDLFPAVGFPDWAIRVFLAVTVSATPLVAVVAWKYDLTTKGFLRDTRDVALHRKDALSQAIGPTTRAAPRASFGRSIVIAAWKNDEGDQCEKEFDSKFNIGRDIKADIRLWDDRVSRRHVEIYPVGDDWYIKDMSSLNGTYVDGHAIDTVKIDGRLEASLDSTGPKVVLTVRVMHDTKVSTQSTSRAEVDK